MDRRDARDIESALQGCRTWPALERRLAEKGYRINVNRRGVLTFYPPEGKGHPVKGYKLDDSYTVEGLRDRLAVRLEGQRPNVKMCAEDLVPDVVLPPMTFEAVASNNLERSKRIERSAARLAAAADAVNIIRERGYLSYADMAADARRLAAEVEALDARTDASSLRPSRQPRPSARSRYTRPARAADRAPGKLRRARGMARGQRRRAPRDGKDPQVDGRARHRAYRYDLYGPSRAPRRRQGRCREPRFGGR